MWCFDCLKEMIPDMYTVKQDTEFTWLDMRIVSESGEVWTKEKYRVSPPFASNFSLLRAFVMGRMKRLEEINPPVNECVRAECDLLSDVLTAVGKKKC